MMVHTVVHTSVFIADCQHAGLSNDEIEAITAAIAADPQAGDLIPGTGGARKRRFAGRGKGKSGGYRTVSYFGGDDVPVVILTLINKGERADMTMAQRNAMQKDLARYAADYRMGARKRK
jgi:hypothetical protein